MSIWTMLKAKLEPLTVHVLVEGRPACGFSDAPPESWPEGNAWVGEHQRGLATCPVCSRNLDTQVS